jgi:N-acetylneuraminate lyase
MNHRKIQGLIAATFTPMNQDGSINIKPIPEYCQYLENSKITGAFINGTTGEGISLTTEERKKTAEEWVKAASSDFKTIIHIGGPSIESCKDLALHAKEIGAYAVAIMGPNFFKPPTNKELIEFVSAIADLVPDLPVYYYHFPSLSGVDLPMPEFLEMASTQIPNLVGMKFTHFNLMEFSQCLMSENGKFDVLHGFDETLLCGLSLGAVGGVGSTYNLMPSVYLKIIEYFKNGDIEMARKMQRISVSLVEILNKYGGALVCGKAIMNLLGMDFGPCRLPVRKLSTAEIDNLKADLEAMDYFSLANA